MIKEKSILCPGTKFLKTKREVGLGIRKITEWLEAKIAKKTLECGC